MKMQYSFRNRFHLAVCALGASLAALTPSAAWAEAVQGHVGIKNKAFVDPVNKPGFLQVKFEGSGGLTSIGAISIKCDDELVNLATGAITATTTITDSRGDRIILSFVGTSANQADGRITFSGPMTVTSGTGRYSRIDGVLQGVGWARSTNQATGDGIGFFTMDGNLRLPSARAWEGASVRYGGIGETSGLDFEFNGQGNASHLGRIRVKSHNVLTEPLNGFVGIINGKVALMQTFSETWFTPNGGAVTLQSFGYLYFEPITQADGTLAPDFSKDVGSENYGTITGSYGRLAGTEGVLRYGGPLLRRAPEFVEVPEFRGTGQIKPASRRDPWCRW